MTRTRRFPFFASLLVAGFVATPPAPAIAQESVVERPVPAPVVPPPEYQRMVDRGWRSADGSPGHSYWQQWTTYDIDARLDPATATLQQ